MSGIVWRPRSSSGPIIAAGFLMLAGAALGVLLGEKGTALPAPGAVAVGDEVRWNDVWSILAHNSRIALQLVAGVLTLGVHALVQLSWIGFALSRDVGQAAGVIPASAIAASIVPHGVLELPAFVLLGSLQFEVLRIARRTFGGEQLTGNPSISALARRGAGAFILLLAAAIVEVGVSGRAGALLP